MSLYLDACKNITAGFIPGGKKEQTYWSGKVLATWLLHEGILRDNLRILDIGAGNGRMAMGIFETGLRVVRYVAIDNISQCVNFMRETFKRNVWFEAYHADVRNDRYYSQGLVDPRNYKFPFGDGIFDLVICMSFFSHTGTYAVLKNYLGEIRRMMDNDGLLLATFFFAKGDEEESFNESKTIYNPMEIEAIIDDMNLDFQPVNNEGIDLDGQSAWGIKKVGIS